MKRISMLIAVCALFMSGCSTDLQGDQYFACAPPSAGDADARCRDGYTCRLVEGNAACVPGEEADQFSEVPSGDAGMSDTEDTTDVEDSGPQDTSDGSIEPDAVDSDDGDGDGDGDDGDTQIDCGDPALTLQLASGPGNEVSESFTLGTQVTASLVDTPEWMNSTEDVTINTFYTEIDSYPQWLSDSPPSGPTFSYNPNSGRWEATIYPQLVGKHGLVVQVDGPGDCMADGGAAMTVEPFDESEFPDRCVLFEYWWRTPGSSSLAVSGSNVVEAGFDEITPSSANNQHYEIGPLQSFTEDVTSELSVDLSRINGETDIFLRVFARSGAVDVEEFTVTLPDGDDPSYKLAAFVLNDSEENSCADLNQVFLELQ